MGLAYRFHMITYLPIVALAHLWKKQQEEEGEAKRSSHLLHQIFDMKDSVCPTHPWKRQQQEGEAQRSSLVFFTVCPSTLSSSDFQSLDSMKHLLYRVNPHTHQLKLCDFGSAKMLVPGEPNISYICSRYYRAPELIFGATEYTTAIDMWSTGCVLAELLLGQPLFPGESGVDQLVEIIKIWGTPTREEIRCMNLNYTEFKFPQIKAHPWHKLEACAHPFFDDLREPTTSLPNDRPLPPLFNFTPQA
ncbi:unnamed protein product [Camellia sinensis]